MEEVFGGLSRDRDGLPAPNIMGRLCEWGSNRAPPTYATYADFKNGLKVKCQETGNPGILRFEPSYEMPDVMYYQSFSEKFLGGKIHLMDQCHEVQKLRKEVQRKPDRGYTQSQKEVQRKPDRRYTQSQTRDTVYKSPNEVGEMKTYKSRLHTLLI